MRGALLVVAVALGCEPRLPLRPPDDPLLIPTESECPPDSELTFRVFVKDPTAQDQTTPSYVSKPGEHSTIVAGLDEKTHYNVWVEAVDPNGNAGQGGDYQIGVVTFEGTPPTFDGARRASATGREVIIVWPPARDNETKAPNIV